MTEEQFVTYLVPAFIALQSVFSGFFIRFGYALFQQWIRFRSRGVAVEATIVDKKTSLVESGGITWFPVVMFTTDTGQVIRTQSADSTGLEPTVGDSLDILYLREDPQQITPKVKLFSWLGFGITAWIIPFFFIFFIIARLPPTIIAISAIAHVGGFILTGWLRNRHQAKQSSQNS